MPLSAALLARRLREARIAAELTQEAAADALGLQRTAMVHIENGNRSVSTLELARLAELYNRSLTSLLDAAEDRIAEDSLVALFRAAAAEGKDPAWRADVSRCVEICRAGAELRKALGVGEGHCPPFYDVPLPQRKSDAFAQGDQAAVDERRRLGLGIQPIADMADLVNAQGIWASGAKLPDSMSGVFLKDADAGIVILVNYAHARVRKRFSYAHEYAHVLFDRKATAIVSWDRNEADLRETRANAFAAAFLLPAEGVHAFFHGRAKTSGSVTEQAAYRPSETATVPVRAQRRAAPGSQAVTFEDVAGLARLYGVSYEAAVYRLLNLRFIGKKDQSSLLEKSPLASRFLSLLRLDDDAQARRDREIVREVVHLAIEAFRREEITGGKLRDLGRLLNVSTSELLALAEAA